MSKYDVLIIGGGPGGYVAAIKAAQLGAKVAVVEREKLGGICLNKGCIPTKTMLKTAKLAEEIQESEDFAILGIEQKKVNVDWKKLLERKDRVVERLVSGVYMLFKKNKIDIYEGEGTVIDKNTVEVNGEKVEGKNLIIATGSKAFYPNIKGLKEAANSGFLVDARKVIDLEDKPKELIILGSSSYAVEYATLFNAIGSKVTVVYKDDDIIPYMEKELTKTLERHLKKTGVKISNRSTIKEIKDGEIVIERRGKEKTIKGDRIIMALGLRPVLSGLSALKLNSNDKGFIKTNERMETNIKGVYAIGDVNGTIPLAHVASAEGIVAVENIMGEDSKIDYNLVPQSIYSIPELATVGLTAEEAKELGYDVSVGKFPLMANGKALAEGETVGLVKIISDKKYGEVLGAHIMTNNATDMISQAVGLMQLEGTIYDLAKTIHPHPTTSEIFMEAAFGAVDKPIHL